VKAPFTWPKSSLSRSCSGSAAVLALRRPVDHLHEEALARPRFPLHQDGDRAVGDLGQELHGFLELGVGGDEPLLVGVGVEGDPGSQLLVLAGQARVLPLHDGEGGQVGEDRQEVDVGEVVGPLEVVAGLVHVEDAGALLGQGEGEENDARRGERVAGHTPEPFVLGRIVRPDRSVLLDRSGKGVPEGVEEILHRPPGCSVVGEDLHPALLAESGHTATAGSGPRDRQTQQLLQHGPGVGGPLEETLHLPQRGEYVAPRRPSLGKSLLQVLPETIQLRFELGIRSRRVDLPGLAPVCRRLLETTEVHLQRSSLTCRARGLEPGVEIQERSGGPLELHRSPLQQLGGPLDDRKAGEELAVGEVGHSLLEGLADLPEGVEAHPHQAFPFLHLPRLHHGQTHHAKGHRLLVAVSVAAGGSGRFLGELQRLLGTPLGEAGLGEPAQRFHHEVSRGGEATRLLQGTFQNLGRLLDTTTGEKELPAELVGEDHLTSELPLPGRLLRLLVVAFRFLPAAPAQRQVPQGELNPDPGLARSELPGDPVGGAQVLLAQLPLAELPVHDPQVQMGGQQALTDSEAGEEGARLLEVENGLAPFAGVLVLQAQVVERARLAGLVPDPAVGGEGVEEALLRFLGTGLSRMDHAQVGLDGSQLLVLVGAAQELLCPPQVAQCPIVLPHLQHDVAAARIDLGEADLVEVTGKNLAGEVELLEGPGVVGEADVAAGGPVVEPGPELPGELPAGSRLQDPGELRQGVGIAFRLVTEIAVFDRLGNVVPILRLRRGDRRDISFGGLAGTVHPIPRPAGHPLQALTGTSAIKTKARTSNSSRIRTTP